MQQSRIAFSLVLLGLALSTANAHAAGRGYWTINAGAFMADMNPDLSLSSLQDLNYAMNVDKLTLESSSPMISVGLGKTFGDGFWRLEASTLRFDVEFEGDSQRLGYGVSSSAHRTLSDSGSLFYLDGILGDTIQHSKSADSTVFVGLRCGAVEIPELNADAGQDAPLSVAMRRSNLVGLGIGGATTLSLFESGFAAFADLSGHVMSNTSRDKSEGGSVQLSYTLNAGLQYHHVSDALGAGIRLGYRIQGFDFAAEYSELNLGLNGAFASAFLYF